MFQSNFPICLKPLFTHPWGRPLSCTSELQRWSPWECWGSSWKACRIRPSSGRSWRVTTGRCWWQCACSYWSWAPRWSAGCQKHSRRRWVSRAGCGVCGPPLLKKNTWYQSAGLCRNEKIFGLFYICSSVCFIEQPGDNSHVYNFAACYSFLSVFGCLSMNRLYLLSRYVSIKGSFWLEWWLQYFPKYKLYAPNILMNRQIMDTEAVSYY